MSYELEYDLSRQVFASLGAVKLRRQNMIISYVLLDPIITNYRMCWIQLSPIIVCAGSNYYQLSYVLDLIFTNYHIYAIDIIHYHMYCRVHPIIKHCYQTYVLQPIIMFNLPLALICLTEYLALLHIIRFNIQYLPCPAPFQ